MATKANMLKVRYIGPKKRISVPFPVPLRSMSEMSDVVTFNRNETVHLPAKDAKQLLKASPDVFKLVEFTKPTIGKRTKEVAVELELDEIPDEVEDEGVQDSAQSNSNPADGNSGHGEGV